MSRSLTSLDVVAALAEAQAAPSSEPPPPGTWRSALDLPGLAEGFPAEVRALQTACTVAGLTAPGATCQATATRLLVVHGRATSQAACPAHGLALDMLAAYLQLDYDARTRINEQIDSAHLADLHLLVAECCSLAPLDAP